MQGTMPMSQPRALLNTSPDHTRHTHSGRRLENNFQVRSLGRIQQARRPPASRTLASKDCSTLIHIQYIANMSLLRK